VVGEVVLGDHADGGRDDVRVDPVELQAGKSSSGANSTIFNVFGIRSTSARVVIISQT
jgi:hypothetical protein